MDEAGIQALPLLGGKGIPAAATGYLTARIGDADDMLARGALSFVNAPAQALGLRPGMSVRDARAILERAVVPQPRPAPLETVAAFGRVSLDLGARDGGAPAHVACIVVDSASSLSVLDAGAIIVTGSHGGLPGNSPGRAMETVPLLASFNDAGIGIDQAGIRRLPVLDQQHIAAVCCHAWSARIGDGQSHYQTGIISTANHSALALGASVGMPLIELIEALSRR